MNRRLFEVKVRGKTSAAVLTANSYVRKAFANISTDFPATFRHWTLRSRSTSSNLPGWQRESTVRLAKLGRLYLHASISCCASC